MCLKIKIIILTNKNNNTRQSYEEGRQKLKEDDVNVNDKSPPLLENSTLFSSRCKRTKTRRWKCCKNESTRTFWISCASKSLSYTAFGARLARFERARGIRSSSSSFTKSFCVGLSGRPSSWSSSLSLRLSIVLKSSKRFRFEAFSSGALDEMCDISETRVLSVRNMMRE